MTNRLAVGPPPAAPSKHREARMDRREHLIDIMEEAAKGETKATLRARIAELEAENERQSSDIAEFMRRLGPHWFLEQGWFPKSVDARRPSEPAVTEAMVEAAAKAVARRWGRDVVWEEDEVVARVALKAALAQEGK